MKKYLTIEVLINELTSDSKSCAQQVLITALQHEYCCDGTVDIKIIDKTE